MGNKKTALISVYRKEGIAEFARGLVDLGWNILASGGTAKHLKEAGIEATDVATLVGEPILGHRVVTLSREVHAGLLATRSPEHLAELEKSHISFIDLVCVDLYPLEEQIAKSKERSEVVEMTDIGGPAMLRAGAKGGRIVICDPADRARVLEWLRARNGDPVKDVKVQGATSHGVKPSGGHAALRGASDDKFVRELAAKAEFVVAQYGFVSASYLGGGAYAGVMGERIAECLYGENAWQAPAALYAAGGDDTVKQTSNGSGFVTVQDPLSLKRFKLIEGTPLSYNNWVDADRLLQTLTHIAAALEAGLGKVLKIAVAVKHGNPCGAAYGDSAQQVLENVIAGDPLAIMGGVVMTNFPIGVAEAKTLASFKMEGTARPVKSAGADYGARRLLDVIIAPSFDGAAIELLRRKKDKCRFVANEYLARVGVASLDAAPRIRYVRGGFLRQPNYTFVLNLQSPMVKRHGPRATAEAERDLAFAWAVGSTSNSNTIALARGGMLLGDGVGQQDRVGAAELVIRRARRAGHDTNGAVAYSDSFFPFSDAPQVLIDAGIRAILSTSGSVRDEDTIKLCEAKGVTLYLIPDKEGRGFFGH